jgi:hypothetical protein
MCLLPFESQCPYKLSRMISDCCSVFRECARGTTGTGSTASGIVLGAIVISAHRIYFHCVFHSNPCQCQTDCIDLLPAPLPEPLEHQEPDNRASVRDSPHAASELTIRIKPDASIFRECAYLLYRSCVVMRHEYGRVSCPSKCRYLLLRRACFTRSMFNNSALYHIKCVYVAENNVDIRTCSHCTTSSYSCEVASAELQNNASLRSFLIQLQPWASTIVLGWVFLGICTMFSAVHALCST